MFTVPPAQSTHKLSSDESSRLKALPHTHDDNYTNIKLFNRDSDLLAIHEAAKLVSRSLSPEHTIVGLLRMMSQMLGLNRGRVLLPSDDKVSIRFSYGLTAEEQRRGVYNSGEGITGKVMLANQLVLIENIDEEPELLFRAVKRSTLPQEVVSYIALPIMDGTSPIGVLACHRIRGRMRPFDADLVILRTFAAFIGQMIKIHQLNEDQNLISKNTSEAGGSSLEESDTKQSIIGISPKFNEALRKIEQVAGTTASVLLTGESGTGKERFAQLLHSSSQRASKPFIAINCAAIPEQLLEAELFGHERGAFTGAVAKKPGKFELADGGTLFLDEVGDLDAGLQTKLLRVLETKSIQRVGGIKDIPIDVRIVVATHKNLMQKVNVGEFRLDLFYRLNVFPIHLPSLRERHEDISTLSLHLLKKIKKEYQRHIMLNQGVLERLERYEWPGNIRQLENVIRRAVLMSEDGKISAALIDSILHNESEVLLHSSSQGQCSSPSTNATTYPTSTEHSESFIESHPRSHPETNSITLSKHSNSKLPITESSSFFNDKQQEPYENLNQDIRRPYSWICADEADEILQALKNERGNKTRAAARLGMSARQFRYRMSKLNIPDYDKGTLK